MSKIAIFASGTGSNAIHIMDHFRNHTHTEIPLLVSNNPSAPVINKARSRDKEVYLINRESFYQTEDCLAVLQEKKIDLIVLAGFMWLIPEYLVRAYSNRMVNIHPALLPAYGGKGMYGMNVHKAVIANREMVSGITIHYVNEEYDRGEIIFQARCKIESHDTPESLSEKVQKLEHAYYATVIENLKN